MRRTHRLVVLTAAIAATAAAPCNARAAVLHSNGPVVTAPGVSTVQPYTNQAGHASPGAYGANATASVGVKLADDFTVSAAAGWDLDAVTLYARLEGLCIECLWEIENADFERRREIAKNWGEKNFSLLKKAVERGVLFTPGSHFLAEGGASPTIRLNFSLAEPEAAERGLAVLADLLRG